MGCSEKGSCIKCDKGGELLVCSDSVCPIVVHEKCLGCPAKFDDMGSFYCPYCLYKQAIAKSCEARDNAMSKKKALSTFIDEEMMDCDKREIYGKAEGKERAQGGVTENIEKSRFYNNETGPGDNDVSGHCIQLGEDKEEGYAPEDRSVSPSREPDMSLLDKKNDFSAVRDSNGAELRDSDHHQMLFGHTTRSAPIVVCGRDDVSCEEETLEHFEVVGHKEKLPGEVDDQKFDRDVGHQQENSYLSGTPVVEEKTSKRTQDNSKTFEESGSRSAEEEHTQVQEQETTASSSEDDSNSEIHSEAKRESNTSNKICRDSETVRRQSMSIKQNGARKALSNSDLSRRSSQKVRKDTSKIGKTNASSKLRKPDSSSTKSAIIAFPHGRRKKVRWTEDEEDMLKEGVQKFSSTVNKNLPWRKILEFGQHIFDSTRTPADLKDKWRNILAKED